GVDLDHGQQRRQRFFKRQPVAELFFDQVTDHPLGLCAKHVQRGVRGVGVGGFLQRQQPDLWAVAVRDDQLVPLCDRRQPVTRHPHVRPLVVHRHRLPAAQQRVPPEGYHASHGPIVPNGGLPFFTRRG